MDGLWICGLIEERFPPQEIRTKVLLQNKLGLNSINFQQVEESSHDLLARWKSQVDLVLSSPLSIDGRDTPKSWLNWPKEIEGEANSRRLNPLWKTLSASKSL